MEIIEGQQGTDMLYVLLGLSTVIMIFGMEGRGEWSRNISIIGGWLWLVAEVLIFIKLGVMAGIISIVIVFLAGGILQRVFRMFLNLHGH